MWIGILLLLTLLYVWVDILLLLTLLYVWVGILLLLILLCVGWYFTAVHPVICLGWYTTAAQPVICVGWYITHIWKTLVYPRIISLRVHKTSFSPTCFSSCVPNVASFFGVYQDRKVSDYIYVC